MTVENLKIGEASSKKFFWKDKTGRGFTNTFSLPDILGFDDEQDESDSFLHEWAEFADPGDVWEDRTMIITCIA